MLWPNLKTLPTWPSRALDALRSLINLLGHYDVLRWEDGTPASPLAAFDSDGEQTDTESIFISVLLPTPGHSGRFGVFVSILISDIDDLLLASDCSAAGCARAVAQALTEAVAAARSVA